MTLRSESSQGAVSATAEGTGFSGTLETTSGDTANVVGWSQHHLHARPDQGEDDALHSRKRRKYVAGKPTK